MDPATDHLVIGASMVCRPRYPVSSFSRLYFGPWSQPRWLSGLRRSRVHSLVIARPRGHWCPGFNRTNWDPATDHPVIGASNGDVIAPIWPVSAPSMISGIHSQQTNLPRTPESLSRDPESPPRSPEAGMPVICSPYFYLCR